MKKARNIKAGKIARKNVKTSRISVTKKRRTFIAPILKYNNLLAKYIQTTIRSFLFNKKGAKYKGGRILPQKRENVESKIW